MIWCREHDNGCLNKASLLVDLVRGLESLLCDYFVLVYMFAHLLRGTRELLYFISDVFLSLEVRSVFHVTPVCDWWSVGVLLFELLTGMVSYNLSGIFL